MKEYDHKEIEPKWQKYWEKKKVFEAKEDPKKKKFFGLIEFPYPSGDGLHVGHIRSNTAMDIITRKRRAEGYEVLYPIGWDAFGLPTENYAIKTGIHPTIVTKNNTDKFRKQLKALGFGFDWEREVNTTDPEYYKWTQWIFLKFLEKGLAYKKKMAINWCPKDKIGLANEEVIDGKCERCGTAVEKREKEQWMLAITKYAERLDKDLDKKKILIGTRNPAKVKLMKHFFSDISGIELISLNDLPPVDDSSLVEGDDFKENARMKSEFYFKKTGIPTISSDHILWIEKWPENNGYMVHIRKHANPQSDRATDEEVIVFLKNFLKSIGGKSKANFHYAFAYTDEKGVVEVDEVPNKYILQEEQAKSFWPGFPTEAFLKDEKTGVFKSDQSDEVRYGKVKEVLKKKFEARMLQNAGGTDYLEKIKTQQKNWIGKSEGAQIRFNIKDSRSKSEIGVVEVFTTRADTLFGVTYIVLAPEHPLIKEFENRVTNNDEVVRYIVQTKAKSEIDRTSDSKEKTGVEVKGIIAINPVNNEEIPVWIADYVLADYGTGAVMAVPAHDQRDFEFAQKYLLPIRVVVREHKETHFLFVVRGLVSDWKEKLSDYKLKMREDWAVEVYIPDNEIEKFIAIAQSLIEVGPYYASTHGNTRFIIYKDKVFDIYVAGENEKAKKYGRELKIPENELDWSEATTDKGILCNSQKFDGLDSYEARKKITEFVGGKMITTFKLRDWVFSRQRYWGEPIPVIHCDKCGIVPVPEKDLPVELPSVENYKPTDNGESPLAAISSWVNVKCPKCKSPAKRETDTMPNWAGSSWYYLRYTDAKNKKAFASQKALEYWTPVDWYNGGMEHTTLHLLYSRFWHKFLFDLGLVPTSEPYIKRTSHGLILGEGGVKMSKSLGNVVNPDQLVETFGADTLRLYEMFMGPFDQPIAWSTESMVGPRRFLERVWRIQEKIDKTGKYTNDKKIESILNKTIKKVGEDIENLRFNTAVSSMMVLLNELEKQEKISLSSYKIYLQLLAPFAPHICEELWEIFGGKKSIGLEPWPTYNEKMISNGTGLIIVQVNGKVRAELSDIDPDLSEEEIFKKAFELQEVSKWCEGKEIKKKIYVKGKLINIVV